MLFSLESQELLKKRWDFIMFSLAIASIIKLNLPLYAIDVNSKFEIEP